jgi:hypothetical protein
LMNRVVFWTLTGHFTDWQFLGVWVPIALWLSETAQRS